MQLITLQRKLKAVTLIESIVYLAIFGVMFIAIMQYVFTIADSNRNATLTNELEKGLIFVNEHLNQSFTEGTSINTGSSAFETDDGVLRLNTASGYLEYSLVDDRLNLNNCGSASFLTSAKLEFSQFYIERVEDSEDNLIGVRVTVTVTVPSVVGLSKTFTTSYLL